MDTAYYYGAAIAGSAAVCTAWITCGLHRDLHAPEKHEPIVETPEERLRQMRNGGIGTTLILGFLAGALVLLGKQAATH